MADLTPNTLPLLRRAALISIASGALASIAFMLRAGRHQQSRILLLLFAIWVLSPFAGALLAHVVSKRWTGLAPPALYLVTLAFSIGSLPIYASVAFGRSAMKAGFVFLIVPLASWLLIRSPSRSQLTLDAASASDASERRTKF